MIGSATTPSPEWSNDVAVWSQDAGRMYDSATRPERLIAFRVLEPDPRPLVVRRYRLFPVRGHPGFKISATVSLFSGGDTLSAQLILSCPTDSSPPRAQASGNAP